MRKIYLGAALAALFFAKPAEAANWVKVVTSKDGLNTMWIDPDRIVRGKTEIFMWTRLSLSAGNYAVTLSAVRCNSHMYMDLKQAVFDRNGASTNMDVKKDWEVAIPDTLIDGAINYACASE
jgi:hypothetical protein